jgi:hypothetical protein
VVARFPFSLETVGEFDAKGGEEGIGMEATPSYRYLTFRPDHRGFLHFLEYLFSFRESFIAALTFLATGFLVYITR